MRKSKSTSISEEWRGRFLVPSLLVTFWLASWPLAQAQDRDGNRSKSPSQLNSALPDAEQVRRHTVMCGPNSLYMLLALHGVPVNHRLIQKYTPSHREGLSLLELKEASTALGLRTEVRHCSIDEIRRAFKSPLIAFLLEGSSRRHYVVIIGITKDSVTALDGTTGERFTLDEKQLKRVWSGYVLIPDTGLSVSWLSLEVSLFFSCLLLGCFAIKVFLSRSPDDSRREQITGEKRRSHIVVLVFVLCMLASQSFSAAGHIPHSEKGSRNGDAYYRTPKNDAANCLYLQLRLLGYTESYESLREQLPDDPRSLSLAYLAKLSRKFGFRLVPVKMAVSELTRTGMPVLLHFEESGIGNGRFLLFLGMNETEGKVALINGADVTLVRMSADDFRRKWTGFALIAYPTVAWGRWLRRSVTALVVISVGYMIFRAGSYDSHLRSALLGRKGVDNADYQTRR